jgi:adenine deaminase
MKHTALVIIVMLLGVLGTVACNRQKHASADTVLIHAAIYTVNAEEPRAQAIAIREGKIIVVDSDKEIAAYQGASTKIIDAKSTWCCPDLSTPMFI